ncbi:MAG: PqqD family protein [Proteobacteria bacterium]|nr:PqqD family protein [Pseudomonadota bacterium]
MAERATERATARADAELVLPAAHVAWQRVGSEIVLLDIPRRQIIGLNGAGGLLWEALHRGQDLLVGAREVARVFDQPVALVGAHAARWAETLLAREILCSPGAARAAACSATAQAGAAVPAWPNDAPGPYDPPAIAWEESLEEAGVYAACGKDAGGDVDPNCLASPFNAAS